MTQRKVVNSLLNDAATHFRSKDVDEAYEAELGDQVEVAEDICLAMDQAMDLAVKAVKDAEASKKDLMAILPKGFGSKFHGDPGSWPAFRKTFVTILKNVDPTVAAATIKTLIEDAKLKKSVKSL